MPEAGFDDTSCHEKGHDDGEDEAFGESHVSLADLRTHPPGIRIQSQLVFWPRSI